MSPKAPPLWTWPASLLLAGLVLGGAWAWEHHVHRSMVDRGFAVDRLAGADVVILGTSKLRCAVLFDTGMDLLLRAGGRRARVVRMTAPGARFSQFAGALEVMRRAPPRLVLVEAELFTLEPGAFREPGTSVEIGWREAARGGLAALVGGVPRYVTDIADYNRPGFGDQPCTHPMLMRPNTYRDTLRERRASTPAERDAMMAQLRALQAAGAVVGLLETNRSAAAARLFPPALARASREALEQAGRDREVLIVGPPPRMAPEAYIDIGHLNAKGRQRYSLWLAQRIDAMLGARR